ncbi:MAG: RNA methyltransferase [Thermomicrobium sp.]|nr:RNA methyltransferase [Thermomicrobium sp.]
MTGVITSRRHPLVQFARSLRERRARERERAFLVEGPRIITEALEAGFRPQLLFFVPDLCGATEAPVIERARALGVRLLPIGPSVLEYLAETVTPQPVIAVFSYPTIPLTVPAEEAWLVLVVDRLQDPGNLGTLLRSAWGAGAHAVLLAPGTVDAYNPKVVRAAAGAHFHLPIQEVSYDRLDAHVLAIGQRVVADARAPTAYDELDWTRPSLLVIGSEAHGVSAEAHRLATHRVAIPLRGGLESLNAAVAGSVILFEAARQRRVAQRRATTAK